MLILDLWGISFHPVVVVGLGNDLLFNFIVAHCGHFDGFLQFTLHIGAKTILYFMANFKILHGLRKKLATMMADCNSHFTMGPKYS